MRFTVDCARVVRPLRHFWQGTGFTPASLLLDADMQEMLVHVGAVPHGGIVHVRIHFLLDLVRGEGFDTPDPLYDWSRLDVALDVLHTNGLKPFFELMGNPSGWFSDFNDDRQLRAWRRLVADLARHCIERYGADEVRSWYFETWNEPDTGWWPQRPVVQPFCRYYDACSAGLRDADPQLRFGGPGTAWMLKEPLPALLAHCDAGDDYFPDQRPAGQGVRLDFVSVHNKGQIWSKENLSPSSRRMIGELTRVIEHVRAKHPRLADVPLMNNEADPIIGWKDHHTWHARPYYAAFAAKMVALHQREIIGRLGANFVLLSNDNGFPGTWGNRTLMTRLGSDEQRARGQFELVKKPILNAMVMLSLLGDEEVAVAGQGELYADLGVLATRRGTDQVAVLVYHCTDKTYVSGTSPVTLRLGGLAGGPWRAVHYRLDEDHGHPLAVWEGQQGDPDRTLCAADVAAMRAVEELPMLGPPVDVSGPDAELTFDLPLPGLHLVLLSRRPEAGPGRVEGLRGAASQGITGQGRVLLRWTGLASRLLQTYEVEYAAEPGGPFVRVNAADTLCTAVLHVHDTPVARGCYRVRAVDYWGRAGAWSEVLRWRV